MRIQIIGAGLAGCAAAAGLANAGHEIALYDTNEQYSGWAICTGKIFAPKSEGALAKRLLDGYMLFRDPKSITRFMDDNFSFLDMLYDECVSDAIEWCYYKNAKQTHKKLSKLHAGKYYTLSGDTVQSHGYKFNAQKAVALTRAAFPNEQMANPDLRIYCKGAWARGEEHLKQVTPVRGVTMDITLNNHPEKDVIFHWPAAGMYYVPSDTPGKYQYGTILMPDKSFGGVKVSDTDKLLNSDNAYMFADWVRNFGVKVSMTGAIGTASAGYRPWLRGKVPGYFFHYQVRNENGTTGEALHIDGLYQSGAQLFFWIARMVARYAKYGKILYMDELNMSTKG